MRLGLHRPIRSLKIGVPQLHSSRVLQSLRGKSFYTRHIKFYYVVGKEYQFRVDRNPDYADYYDMITAPELMEGEAGLFAVPFQQKYGKLIETLFSQIAMSDDTQLNARKQSELQQNIERFTDFRTYLKFDLETTDQNGSKQLLSQTLNTKSGGETQTPFYT